jgi:thymidylate kinase
MAVNRAKLIVFEGPDGIGKSQLSTDLANWLNQQGTPALRLSFPGNAENTLGELVYQIHHKYRERFQIPTMNPLSLQILHVAAHIDEIDRAIRPAIDSGSWVILDRFWWSTWVYGMAAGANRKSLELIIQAERVYWADLAPGAIFLVKRAKPVRQEHSEQVFDRLSQLYDELRERERISGVIHEIENEELATSLSNVCSTVESLRIT